MKIQRTLFFCFITGASCFSHTAAPSDSAGLPVFIKTEGESISFGFLFPLVGGGWRYLCREECKHNGIIIDTNSADTQAGRYSLSYHRGLLQVTIKDLKASDSGRYRCGVVSSSITESYEEVVEIRVIKAPRTPSATEVSTTHQQPTSRSVFLLVVGGCAVVGGVFLAGFLTLLYKRISKTRANSSDSMTTDAEVNYENWPPGCRSEDAPYQNLDPASMDQEPVYLTLT